MWGLLSGWKKKTELYCGEERRGGMTLSCWGTTSKSEWLCLDLLAFLKAISRFAAPTESDFLPAHRPKVTRSLMGVYPSSVGRLCARETEGAKERESLSLFIGLSAHAIQPQLQLHFNGLEPWWEWERREWELCWIVERGAKTEQMIYIPEWLY